MLYLLCIFILLLNWLQNLLLQKPNVYEEPILAKLPPTLPGIALNIRTSTKLFWVIVLHDLWRKLSQQFSPEQFLFLWVNFLPENVLFVNQNLPCLIILKIKKYKWNRPRSSERIHSGLAIVYSWACIKPRVGKLWPAGQVQPAPCYCKCFIGTLPWPFIYVYNLWLFSCYKSWVAVAETTWSLELKIYSICIYIKKACQHLNAY